MLNESSLDHAFQALPDPARRNMLSRLARGPASVSELAAPLRMSLPAVLQHLKALEESGLSAPKRRAASEPPGWRAMRSPGHYRPAVAGEGWGKCAEQLEELAQGLAANA